MGPREESQAEVKAEALAPRRSLARFMGMGAAVGLLGGAVSLGFAYALHLVRPGVTSFSWPTFLVTYPIMGALFGWLLHRNPESRGRVFRRPEGFFATGPMPDDEREARASRVRRSAWTGAAVGVLAVLTTAAVDFACRGWPYLGGTLMPGLIFYPYLGAMFGVNQGLRRGDPKPSLRSLRFRMRTLMILTAYLAFLLGVGVRIAQTSGVAWSSLVRAQNARATGEVYRTMLDRSLQDLHRAQNAKALRAGHIPGGITPDQRTFLKSLDGTSTEEYKKYRYGLIADGEQRTADLAAWNVDILRRIVEHQEQLAEKYDAAVQRPWLPIAPDPPMPR